MTLSLCMLIIPTSRRTLRPDYAVDELMNLNVHPKKYQECDSTFLRYSQYKKTQNKKSTITTNKGHAYKKGIDASN